MKLLACPFCGSKAELGQIEDGDDMGGYYVQCTNGICGVSTPLQFSLKEDCRPLLVERWNRRNSQSHITQDGDEVAADDKGSVRVVKEKDGTVTLAVRSPRSTGESMMSVPWNDWILLSNFGVEPYCNRVARYIADAEV